MRTYERGNNATVAYRLLKSLALFFSWICLGLWNEIQGPTLNDLRRLINANYEEISRVLSVRSGGTLVGSLIGGVLHDRFRKRRDLFLTLALFIAGLGILVAPHCRALWLMGIFFFVQGLGHGLLTTGGNPTMILLWADLAAGPLMFLHSGFGIGAAVSPFLARPFLSNNKTVNNTSSNSSNTASQWTSTYDFNLQPVIENEETVFTDPFNPYPFWSDTVSPYARVNSSVKYVLTPTRIHIPYMIIGVICFLVGAAFFTFHFIKLPEIFKRALFDTQATTKRMFSPASCTGGERGFGIQMLVLVFFFYLLTVGGERAYGKFVYSYARKSELKFSKTEAALLNSVYWISFTVARLVAFIVARWIPVRILLFVEVFGTAISAIFLNIFHNKRIPFWIFTSLLGFFKSPIFPSCLGWINRYMEVTSMVIVIVNVGGAVGGIFFQWLTGYLFQNHGPQSFLYTILAYSIAITLVFIVMHIVAHRHGERFKKSDASKTDTVSIILQNRNLKVHPCNGETSGIDDLKKNETRNQVPI